jgi:hypothetical protein
VNFFSEICNTVYKIKTFKKYLFGLVVTVHLITVIGIPVYFHYCGGELEEISYILKSNSCCGEEEDDSSMTPGCCENESVVVRSEGNFDLKKNQEVKSSALFATLFFVKLPFFANVGFVEGTVASVWNFYPPPGLQHQAIIENTFLRI